MASFTRPFDPSLVTRVSPDTAVTLPDPDFTPGDPIARPRVARYAGAALILLQVTANSPVTLFPPVTGSARNIDLDTPLAANIGQLLEISPLPFSIRPALRALRPGAPAFYLGYERPEDTPPDDQVTRIGGGLASLASGSPIFLGALFQDGVSLAPWAWIERIGSALADAGDSAGAAEWNSLAALYGSTRSLRVLDHSGRPAGGSSFTIRIHRTDGGIDGPWTRAAGGDGDLEASAAGDPLDRPDPAGGVTLQPSLFGEAGEQTELLWAGQARPGEGPLPVHALYAAGSGTAPGEPVLLPAGTTRGQVQVLELGRWFAPPPASVNVAHFHASSRLEPFVDGTPTYIRMVDDLLASTGAGNGAHFAGWAFKEFPLQQGRLDGQGNEVDTRINALTQRLIDSQADARFLVNKFITFKEDPDTTGKLAAISALLLLATLPPIAGLKTNALGYAAIALAAGLVLKFLSLEEFLLNKAEESKDIFPILNGIKDGIAVFSPHPATLDDNPIKDAPLSLLGINVFDFLDRFGTWHQKFQCIKRGTPDADGNHFVAYLGGIDINVNRLDTPGHQIDGPYHDIHARVTGPAAADVFRSFDERWAFEQDNGSAALGPAFPPPQPEGLANEATRAAGHLVQIARTHFAGAGGTAPFSNFAPDGERTIHDTLVRAIRSAREYIYIEDQYFVPNDRQNAPAPGTDLPDTYLDALIEAAGSCKRLIVLVPSIAALDNQPFSRLRRDHALARLRDPGAWGARMLAGAPMRRPVLPASDLLVSEGRCKLLAELPELQGHVLIGPRARVPQSDLYWLWIDGELMIARGPAVPVTVDGSPGMEVQVMRGQNGANRRWGASTRRHLKGAPVTMSKLRGIFVHAKIMIVDDVFVSIGSANVNRRGFFYDGEINAFAIPQALKDAPLNPARELRTALWAEHLNLSPTMGGALLGDPIAAFDLFRRTPFAGNRFMQLESLDLNPDLGIPLSDAIASQVLLAAGVTLANSLISKIWNDASDPTSFTDPDPTPGPFPGF
jgi:phosphatidylserine/phosphatidylglycerophosphate/cardiolipin synthase-like enzyme